MSADSKAVSAYTHNNCPNGHAQLSDREILGLVFGLVKTGWSNTKIAGALGMTPGRISDVYNEDKQSFGPRLREIVSAAACSMITPSTTTFVRDGLRGGTGGVKRQQWLAAMEAHMGSSALPSDYRNIPRLALSVAQIPRKAEA